MPDRSMFAMTISFGDEGRRLEAQLGVRRLNRTTRTVVPVFTEAGDVAWQSPAQGSLSKKR
jgi:hypothetical protein